MSSSSYSSKLAHMRSFEPLLCSMIGQLERRVPEDDAQLQKLRSLLHVLAHHDHTARPMAMDTLDKCREVLLKLHSRIEEDDVSEQSREQPRQPRHQRQERLPEQRRERDETQRRLARLSKEEVDNEGRVSRWANGPGEVQRIHQPRQQEQRELQQQWQQQQRPEKGWDQHRRVRAPDRFDPAPNRSEFTERGDRFNNFNSRNNRDFMRSRRDNAFSSREKFLEDGFVSDPIDERDVDQPRDSYREPMRRGDGRCGGAQHEAGRPQGNMSVNQPHFPQDVNRNPLGSRRQGAPLLATPRDQREPRIVGDRPMAGGQWNRDMPNQWPGEFDTVERNFGPSQTDFPNPQSEIPRHQQDFFWPGIHDSQRSMHDMHRGFQQLQRNTQNRERPYQEGDLYPPVQQIRNLPLASHQSRDGLLPHPRHVQFNQGQQFVDQPDWKRGIDQMDRRAIDLPRPPEDVQFFPGERQRTPEEMYPQEQRDSSQYLGPRIHPPRDIHTLERPSWPDDRKRPVEEAQYHQRTYCGPRDVDYYQNQQNYQNGPRGVDPNSVTFPPREMEPNQRNFQNEHTKPFPYGRNESSGGGNQNRARDEPHFPRHPHPFNNSNNPATPMDSREERQWNRPEWPQRQASRNPRAVRRSGPEDGYHPSDSYHSEGRDNEVHASIPRDGHPFCQDMDRHFNPEATEACADRNSGHSRIDRDLELSSNTNKWGHPKERQFSRRQTIYEENCHSAPSIEFESPASPDATETPLSPETPASPPAPTVVRDAPKVIPLERREDEDDTRLRTQRAIRALSGQSQSYEKKPENIRKPMRDQSRFMHQKAFSPPKRSYRSPSSDVVSHFLPQEPVMKRPQTYGDYKRMKEALVQAEAERMRRKEEEKSQAKTETEDNGESRLKDFDSSNHVLDNTNEGIEDDDDDDSEHELLIAELATVDTELEINGDENKFPPIGKKSSENTEKALVSPVSPSDTNADKSSKDEANEGTKMTLAQTLISSLAEEDASRIEHKMRQRALKANKLTLKELKALLLEDDDEETQVKQEQESKKVGENSEKVVKKRSKTVEKRKLAGKRKEQKEQEEADRGEKRSRTVRRSQRLQRESIALSSEDEPMLMIDEGSQDEKESESEVSPIKSLNQNARDSVEFGRGPALDSTFDTKDSIAIAENLTVSRIQDNAISSSTVTGLKAFRDESKKIKENEDKVPSKEGNEDRQFDKEGEGEEVVVKTEVDEEEGDSNFGREKRSRQAKPKQGPNKTKKLSKNGGKKSKIWVPKGGRGPSVTDSTPILALDESVQSVSPPPSVPKRQPADMTVFLVSADIALDPLRELSKPSIESGLRHRLESINNKGLTSIFEKLNRDSNEDNDENEKELNVATSESLKSEKETSVETDFPLIVNSASSTSSRLGHLLQSVQDSLGLAEAPKESLDSEEQERKARAENKNSLLPFVRELKREYSKKKFEEVDSFVTVAPQLGDEQVTLQIQKNLRPGPTEDIVHDMSKFFKCNGCKFSSDNTEEFLSHLYSDGHTLDLVEEKRPFFLQCIYCSKHAASQEKLLVHLIKNHGHAKYQCGLCYFRSCTKLQIMIHLQIVHPNSEPQFVISKHLPPDSDEEEYSDEIDDFSDSEDENEEGQSNQRSVLCYFCLESFSSFLSFVLHMTAEHPYDPVVCRLKERRNKDDDCNEVEDCNEDEIDISDIESSDKEELQKRDDLSTSLTTIENTRSNNNVRRTYVCVLCGFEDESQQVLKVRQHMRTVHKVLNTKVVNVKATNTETKRTRHRKEAIDISGQQLQKCLLVPKRAHLMGPSKSKSKDTFFPSDLDAESLPRNSTFMRAVHCGICDFSTKIRANLVHHLRLHLKNKANVPLLTPVNPPNESKELAASKMQSLIASDHQDKDVTRVLTREELDALPVFVDEKQRFRCSECIYATTDANMLLDHMETLHPGQGYNCPHCPASSPIPLSSLEFHLWCHGSLLFACPYCNYFHWQKRLAETHVATEHPTKRLIVKDVRAEELKRAALEAEEERQKILQQSRSEAESSRITSYEPFKCGLCSESSENLEGIKSHLKFYHDIEDCRQYGCALHPSVRSDNKMDLEAYLRNAQTSDREKGCKKENSLILRYFSVESTTCTKALESDAPKPLWSRENKGPRHIRGILYEDEIYEEEERKENDQGNDGEYVSKNDGGQIACLIESNSSEDTKHVVTHEYTCVRCGVTKQSVDSLKAHIRLTHLRGGKLLCRVCDFSANLESSMATHFMIQHPDMDEPDFEQRKEEDDESSWTEEYWKAEWNIPTEAEINNSMLNSVCIKNLNTNTKGKKRKGPSEISLGTKKKSKKSTFAVSNGTSKTLDLAKKIKSENSDSNDGFVVANKESSSTPKSSSVSLFESAPTFKCNFCPKRSQKLDSLKEHLITSHQVADESGYKVLSRDEVVDLLTTKQDTNEQQCMYECYFCDHVVGDISALQRHFDQEHKESALKVKSIQGKGISGYLECQLCGHLTSGLERSTQKVHYHEEHPDVSQIVCSKYLVSFKGNESNPKRGKANWGRFNGHVINCVFPQCEFKASSFLSMLNHLRKHAQSFKCGHCGLVHRSLVDFNTHSALLHGDKIPDQVKDPEAEAEYEALKALVKQTLLDSENSTTSEIAPESTATTAAAAEISASATNMAPLMDSSSSSLLPPSLKSSDLCAPSSLLCRLRQNTARKSTGGQRYFKLKRLTARKSTSKLPRQLAPFSFYGQKEEPIDLAQLATHMTVAGLEIPLSAKKMSEFVNLEPTVRLYKVNNKEKGAEEKSFKAW